MSLVTGPAPSEVAAHDAQALIEEARRRQRRRHRVIAFIVAGLLGIGGVITALETGGSPPRPSLHSLLSPGLGATASRTTPPVNSIPPTPMVLIMGRLSGDAAWVGTGEAIYVTNDEARRWRNVTPSLIAQQNPGTRVDSMVGTGTRDLWLSVENVIGLVPYSQSVDGSDRGEGIVRSADGGRTWTFGALPDCLQTCGGDLSLSFINSKEGFATESPTATNTALLFGTTDGGTTWSEISTFPFQGSSPDIEFTNALDGWALSGPTFASEGNVQNPGGSLYRTSDGGATWRIAPGLPRNEQFNLPTFFGSDSGVVLASALTRHHGSSATVFTTTNGGATWLGHSVPKTALAGVGSKRESNLSLVATSFSRWLIFSGSSVYGTTNAGLTWTTTHTTLTWSPSFPGQPAQVFFTAMKGLAIAVIPLHGSGACSSGCGYSVLEQTTDGGRTWSANPFNK